MTVLDHDPISGCLTEIEEVNLSAWGSRRGPESATELSCHDSAHHWFLKAQHWPLLPRQKQEGQYKNPHGECPRGI